MTKRSSLFWRAALIDVDVTTTSGVRGWCVRAISHSTCTTYIRVHIGKIVVEMADVVTLIMISTSDSRLMVTAIVMSVSSSSCQCVRIMIAAF